VPRLPWTDMRWSFDRPAGLHPLLIERLRGTPPRARWLVGGLSETRLRERIGETWSIQENVAHLIAER